ncbi:MAG: hypothetical protein R6U70_10345 [Bacillota bacterium]
MTDILLTGFGPFGGSGINPSGETVGVLDGSEVKGRRIAGVVLPVSWSRSHLELYRAIADVKPRVIMCLGQSSRESIALERVAINCCEGSDNDGVERSGSPAVSGGPDGLFSRLPLEELRSALDDEGIPARISNSAGTYLCNYVMYRLLHGLEETDDPSTVAGFVHVPSLPQQAAASAGRGRPSMSQDLINRAVVVMLTVLF